MFPINPFAALSPRMSSTDALQHLLGAPLECTTRLRRTLFARREDFTAFLSPDLIGVVLDFLFRRWPKATVVMRVNKELQVLAGQVRAAFGLSHNEWWTGSGHPLTAVEPADVSFMALRNRGLAKLAIRGATIEDVDLLLRPNEWLNNFNISLVLKCAQPNMIVGPNLYGASPTCILDHSLASLLTMNSASTVATTSASWGNATLHTVLRTKELILFSINAGGNHWLPVRLSPQRAAVEIFLLMGGAYEHTNALQSVQQFVDYFVAINVLPSATHVTITCHKKAAWRQTDGCSCGLYTCAVLISLARGLRIHLDISSNPQVWRHFFVGLIQDRIVELD